MNAASLLFSPLSLLSLLSILLVSSGAPAIGSPKQTTGEIYLGLVDGSLTWSPEVVETLTKRWSTAHVPMILEAGRLSGSRSLPSQLFAFMMTNQPNELPLEWQPWQNWLWNQEYEPDESYPQFKSDLYQKIDERFADYFDNKRKATIRLDEIVWGGVIRDGIPPLHSPKMITPEQASYLGDGDIVFGIEVEGELRAYPKRILAWHEMFTDTIQGVPLAGVY